MTTPVQEPTQGRDDRGQAWRTSQLFRRPAPAGPARFQISDQADTPVVALDGWALLMVPQDMVGMRLISAAATLITAGGSGTSVGVTLVGFGQLMTDPIFIDSGDTCSYQSTPQPTFVDQPLVLCDRLTIDINVAGSGAEGLVVALGFA